MVELNIAKELKKRGIPYQEISIDLEKLDFPFPSLEKTLIEFVGKNSLLIPERKIETHGGLIATWDNRDIVLLSIKPEYIEGLMRRNSSRLQPIGDGSHMYSSDERRYNLSGILKGKQTSLMAEMTYTQKYEMRHPEGMCHCVKQPFATGDNKVSISRKDNEKYWFLTGPKETPKSILSS